jgi:hypothetical protein
MNVEIADKVLFLPDYIIEFQEELPLNHEPSLDHWARLIAEDDIATGYHSSKSHAYECAWNSLDAEYNYSYV